MPSLARTFGLGHPSSRRLLGRTQRQGNQAPNLIVAESMIGVHDGSTVMEPDAGILTDQSPVMKAPVQHANRLDVPYAIGRVARGEPLFQGPVSNLPLPSCDAARRCSNSAIRASMASTVAACSAADFLLDVMGWSLAPFRPTRDLASAGWFVHGR